MRFRTFVFALTILAVVSGSAQAARTKTPEFGTHLPVAIPVYLNEIIREASTTHNVDANLIAAVVFKESAFNRYAVSRRGAQGMMQLMPKTANYLGVKDAFDPRDNILGGTKYLRMMLDEFDGDVELALAAYNAGPNRVKKLGVGATAESLEYVSKIKTYL